MHPRSAVPGSPTRFVGRRQELEALAAMLEDPAVHLVTLTGPPGVGKTRLALEFAKLRNGATFVPLADVREPSMVVPTLARVLGGTDLDPDLSFDVAVELARTLTGPLVFDNFEHLLAAATQVARLLEECRDLRIVVTSRAPLGLRGEQCLLLGPLELPSRDDASAAAVAANDAVALFVERVASLGVPFALSDENTAAVVSICCRLDGIPLALELAAPRLRVMSPEGLAASLTKRLPLLTGGPRDAPARQRTMRDALAWSYDLLASDEARVFRRLAVFAGGFTLDAVIDVCGDDSLHTFEQLVAQSLVTSEDGARRFRLLEVVREFAAELLSPDQADDARRLHAAHYLELAERAEMSGTEQSVWLDRLAIESPNFAEAVWFAVRSGDATTALRLCVSLRFLWYTRGPIAEGRALFGLAIEMDGADPALRARAMADASALARQQGDLESATELSERAVATAEEGADAQTLAFALLQRGFVGQLTGDYATARPALVRSIELAHEAGDRAGKAFAQHHLAVIAYHGDGDSALAWELHAQCLALFREVGNRRHVATNLVAMAELARARGDITSACELLRETFDIVAELGDLGLLVHALHTAAYVAADDGRFVRAMRLVGAADGIERRTGTAPWPRLDFRSTDRFAALEGRMGRRRAASVRRHGTALTPVEAAALGRAFDADEPSDPLTSREREIAGLVADGLTNRAIAERLIVSERTVDGHVGRILAKLGFTSRAQVAAWIAGSDARV